MKFSVLLPTRNRLDLLQYAVETVRRQDHDDWEIIVSDNCSDDDVGGYVASVGDPRIRCFRTERFVPVTENWNNALVRATGDWVVMLGDDDGLLRGYFTTLRREIERRPDAELVYTSALLYAYPNVMPDAPDGYLQTYGYASFLESAREPFWLEPATAHALVRESMRFRVRFGYNMQFAAVSRGLVETLQRKGEAFQSPYPDYYAMNALLLVSRRTLVLPDPLVAIGISPKSFGYYYFNDSEQIGVDFLKNVPDQAIVDRVRDRILPGTNMNTSWLLSMETLLANYGHEFPIEVDYGRYRLLQLLQVVRRAIASGTGLGELRDLAPRLSSREKLCVLGLLGPYAAASALAPERYRKVLATLPLSAARAYPPFTPRRIPGRFANMLEVFEKVDGEAIRAAGA
jgi:glycosyltransferase involved in cell wall biosynthesis